MTCAFQPGQFVICINDDPWGVWQPADVEVGDLDGLKCGTIYTVRAVTWFEGEDLVLLEELRRDYYEEPWGEYGWAPERFRPVDDSKIEVFRAMLRERECENV